MLRWDELTWDGSLDNLARGDENVYLIEFSRVPKELNSALLGDTQLRSCNHNDFPEDTRVLPSGAKVFLPREIYKDMREVMDKHFTFLQSRHVVVSQRFLYLVRKIVFEQVPATHEKRKNTRIIHIFPELQPLFTQF